MNPGDREKGKGEKVQERERDGKTEKHAKSLLQRTSRLHNLRQEKEHGGRRRGGRAIGRGCNREKGVIVSEETCGFD